MGRPQGKGTSDLAECFTVRLPKDGSKTDDRLIKVMSALFAKDKVPAEKARALAEVGIPVAEEIERRASDMGSYSQWVKMEGIKEGIRMAIEEGINLGIDRGVVQSYFAVVNDGYPADRAKKVLSVTDEMIRKYQEAAEAGYDIHHKLPRPASCYNS